MFLYRDRGQVWEGTVGGDGNSRAERRPARKAGAPRQCAVPLSLLYDRFSLQSYAAFNVFLSYIAFPCGDLVPILAGERALVSLSLLTHSCAVPGTRVQPSQAFRGPRRLPFYLFCFPASVREQRCVCYSIARFLLTATCWI